MQIVRPSVERWKNPATREERLKHIERAARVCYKSESRITDGSAERFLAAVMRRGHLSVIEHGNIVIKPSVSTYEWLRTISEFYRLDKGEPCRLRFSPCQDDAQQRSVVSGNVRAWHDLFQWCALNGLCLPQGLVDMVMDNRILFSDIDLESVNPVASRDYSPEASTNPEIFILSALDQESRAIHQTHTLKFITDRGVSHEIVRHRVMSFSQESTRYCNYSNGQFGGEITVVPCVNLHGGAYEIWRVAMIEAEALYHDLLADGCTPQEARSVLPTSLKTEVVVTGTGNDWKHFLALRTAPDAHPDMIAVAKMAAQELKKADPEVFADA